ncbi:MAG TPA: hypothetical protein VE826_12165 [Dongiaceae bacterium]|nr:hypothetical protein [Dongiaceae bacterium]
MIHALTFATYAVTLNGRPVLPHARAAVLDGRILLPVRALGNALGAGVSYDGRGNITVQSAVQGGRRVANIAGHKFVRIVNGRAYAPLRTIANALAMDVRYDALARTVALTDGARVPAHMEAAHTVKAAPTVIVGDAVQPPLVVTVSPQPNAHVHDPYPSISARFAGAASLDPHSLQVRIDERDVTADTSVLGDQVLITPRAALTPGTHVVTISGRDVTGAAIAQQWSFVDTFAFSNAPPPARVPVYAIWIDRWITPGTNAFDVYVQGAPGLTGYVGVEGVSGFFPLQVYSANAYVAHVFVPNGVNQPFARIAARLTLPNGVQQTIVLPQTVNLTTPPIQPNIVTPAPSPVPRPSPRAVPTRRSVDVPTASPSPSAPPRRSLLTTTPSPVPTAAPAPPPSATPGPVRTRRPLLRRTPAPTPSPAPP